MLFAIPIVEKNKAIEIVIEKSEIALMKLMADVNHFVGDAEQHDDLTIVAVKVH